MRRSCLDCEYFDKEHYDMYEEAICTKADETTCTYLYGGWMPVPQVCCTGGPEKTNCKNCGASLRGHYRCEYCWTVNN